MSRVKPVNKHLAQLDFLIVFKVFLTLVGCRIVAGG